MQRDGSAVTPIRPPFDLEGPNARLAELVAHLTGCPAPVALDAVDRSVESAEAAEAGTVDQLAVVASAMVLLKRDIDLREARRTA
jgi:hypothetical protein